MSDRLAGCLDATSEPVELAHKMKSARAVERGV